MQEDQILFEKLQYVGLSEQDVRNLPEDFKNSLMNGELTPVICTSILLQNGDRIAMPLKLRMMEEDGNVSLMVYPSYNEFKNHWQLPSQSFEDLKTGAILHVDGQYIQRDPETNCLLKVSEKELDLERKIADLEKVRDIELGVEQKNQIRNGKPVELNVGGEICTVGLDLNDRDHFKTLQGGLNDWEYQQKIVYDILHPEYMGVVKTDENRWEYQQIVNSEKFPESLRQKPAMAQNTSMRV